MLMILSLSELILALKHTKPGAKVQKFRVTGVRFGGENAVKGQFFALSQEFLAQRRRLCAIRRLHNANMLGANHRGKPMGLPRCKFTKTFRYRRIFFFARDYEKCVEVAFRAV